MTTIYLKTLLCNFLRMRQNFHVDFYIQYYNSDTFTCRSERPAVYIHCIAIICYISMCIRAYPIETHINYLLTYVLTYLSAFISDSYGYYTEVATCNILFKKKNPKNSPTYFVSFSFITRKLCKSVVCAYHNFRVNGNT